MIGNVVKKHPQIKVVATTLLPAALVFLILLLNNEELMGKGYKNTPFQNAVNFSIVIGLILLSTGYTLTTLFPGLFGG